MTHFAARLQHCSRPNGQSGAFFSEWDESTCIRAVGPSHTEFVSRPVHDIAQVSERYGRYHSRRSFSSPTSALSDTTEDAPVFEQDMITVYER